MDVRNRMADVVKLRCNACQDFLRMILKEGWQQKLYDKAHYEVSNNTRYKDKYIATYEHMRDSENAIANFSVDDMDVTLITELVVTHFVGIESVERATCNALKELRDNRNLTNHSNENEDADELYFSRFSGLSGSGFPAPNRPFFIRRFLGISNIVVCSVMEHTTLLDFSFVILPPLKIERTIIFCRMIDIFLGGARSIQLSCRDLYSDHRIWSTKSAGRL